MAYPIFPTPASIFDGSTDYPAAAVLCKQMYSYLKSVGGGIANIPRDELQRLTPLMQCVKYDAPNDLDNEARWEDDIQSSYYLLYKYV